MAKQLKKSSKMYRNINGVRYEHYTSDLLEFAQAKIACKKKSVKFRIINGEFFKQVL